MLRDYNEKVIKFPTSDISRFGLVMISIFIVILLVIFFERSFSGGERNLKITVADIPSSYNSTKFINNNFGMMAAVGEVKKPAPDSIKIVSSAFYDGITIIFREMYGFIVKTHNLELRNKNYGLKSQQ